MDDYRVPTDEQETVIQFDRNSDTCTVYTTDSTVMTKLDKIHKRIKEDFSERKPIAAYYRFDKRLFSFRSKIPTRKMNEEQRKATGERLKRSRKMR